MHKTTNFANFILNGMRVLRVSAKGEYNNPSQEIQFLRQDLFKVSTRKEDQIKLKNDINNIGRDLRVSLQKISTNNG